MEALKVQEEIRAPKFVEPRWWNEPGLGLHGREYKLHEIVRAFIEGKLKGVVDGSYSNGLHYYSTKKKGTELWLFKDNPTTKLNVCVAKKINSSFMGNSSSIDAYRRPRDGQLQWLNGGRTKIQEILGDCMPMIPFRMLQETKLDINSLYILDRGEDEMLDLGRMEKAKKVLTHFMGAMLFKIHVRQRSRELEGIKDKYFLFDIDRNDLALKNFNMFLSVLCRPCDSIQDAYASLKPQEIYDAERFLGKECPRQGEWFFIPIQGEFKVKIKADVVEGKYKIANTQVAKLEVKGSRPHYVDKMSAEGHVQGWVRHGGRDHIPFELKGWHRPVPNTATESFKISGMVD